MAVTLLANVEFIWSQHNNLVIRDVYETMQDKVKNFMLENSFKPNRLFEKLNFQEDPDIDAQYLKYVEHILKDESSIVVLDDTTDAIQAVALCKCMTKEWRSWTAFKLCANASQFTDIMDLQYHLLKEYAGKLAQDEIDEVDEADEGMHYDSYHVFETYIPDELRNDSEFLKKFFNAMHETARHLKMENITCFSMNKTDQELFFEHNFRELNRAFYSIYRVEKRRPFAILRDIDEMEALLFGFDVKPIFPYQKMKVRGIDSIDQSTRDLGDFRKRFIYSDCA